MVTTRLYFKFTEELPRVDGKVIVITGTTSGTGFVAARTAAAKGGEVVLLNRKSERAIDSLKALKEAVPEGKFIPIECDLQDFSSVRSAIQEIKSKYNKIYCLANNAGIMATPDQATGDGYDTQMQTNHLSHFLLTRELFPLLEAEAEETGDARIVNHSSMGRLLTPNDALEEKYFGKNGGDLGGDGIKMLGGACFHRYFQSKLANSVFTYGLHEKLQARNSKIRAVCAHPGGSDTNLDNHLNYGWHWNLIVKIVMPFMAQTAEDGAIGLIKGMMDPKSQSGVLYGPLSYGGLKGPAVPNPPKPFETDVKAIAMLWSTSEKATGVEFDI
jgi:NAD(P)-dependent dehydrogenase (short-subunit alcohol dehydrogenase family)